eukprot:NODE_4051_length_1238_cov_77.915695_g3479_i1.p1 GENE.NODE_4051_length_1238_cov_77.915695_g3479_i1~~NODE_4051_length_1238_cov_77.915695_g3479_i1.p1  ORF type:complete len:238 (-),score=37.03 NODE_4051_length_1238_cov_77.915695_g3479_i1:410-1123(-)
MEHYLHDRRRAMNFSPADTYLSAALDPPPMSAVYPHSAASSLSGTLSSTTSSIKSQDMADFVSEFRSVYANLPRVRAPGMLTKAELAEILFLLDQEATEDMLTEMFNEVDINGRGSVDFEAFLCVMASRIRDSVRGTSSMKSSPPSSAPNVSRTLMSTTEVAAASAAAAAGRPSGGPVVPSTPGQSRAPLTSSGNLYDAKMRRDSHASVGSKLTSAGGRKPKPMILWWGFQDLADTL